MTRKLSAQTGMSLVEATIILMTLAILTAVIAPSVGDYLEESRNVKAKEDVEAIGTAIMRMVRDTGIPCLAKVASPTSINGCALANRVEILYTSGSTPTVTASASTGVGTGTVATDATSYNWLGTTSAGISPNQTNLPMSNSDTVDNQLVLNTPGGAGADAYTAVSFTGGGGPGKSLGWRGAYLTGPVGADPWGAAYEANTVFLSPASDSASGTGEGQLSGGWSFDTFVISAGSNGSIDTALALTGASASKDDVIYTIQGSTR